MMLDLLIIGGGIHGTHIAHMLSATGTVASRYWATGRAGVGHNAPNIRGARMAAKRLQAV